MRSRYSHELRALLFFGVTSATTAHAEGGPQVTAPAAAVQSGRLELIEAALAPTPNGLTAREVVARALETSPRLKSATIQGDKAQANKARAKLAFAPRLDLLARYTHLSRVDMPTLNNGGGGGGAGGMSGSFTFPQVLDQYYTSAGVTLPITDLFLTIVPTYKGASRMSEVAEYQRQAAELEVSYQARVAFYDYLRAVGAVVVVEDGIRVLTAHVADLEALSKAGTVSPTDLLRARAELRDNVALRTRVQGHVEVTTVRLSQLLGVPVDLKRGIGEPLAATEIEPTPDTAAVISQARSQRPELRALRALEQAREHFVDARRGARWPQLRAGGNVYYAQPNPRVFPQQKEFDATWDVGLLLSWSPNDTLTASSQADDANTDLELVRQDLRAVEDGVTVEAVAAVTDHRSARDEMVAKIESAEASLRRYNDQRALMLAGAATPNDVLEAERELRRAQLEWVDAFVHARMAEAALLKAQGQTGLSAGARSGP